MRALVITLATLSLSCSAVAGPTMKVKLSKDMSFTLSVDPSVPQHVPAYMNFIVSRKGKEVVETKGDPLIFFGGKQVGMWPCSDVTYVFKSGLRITGHATSKTGNPQSFEITRADGSMTLVRGADTLYPTQRDLTPLQGLVWRTLYQKKTFELIID